jgi:hypothetical protein
MDLSFRGHKIRYPNELWPNKGLKAPKKWVNAPNLHPKGSNKEKQATKGERKDERKKRVTLPKH